MNVLSNVTLNTLKRNKTRTLITVFGIILSTALITAIIIFSTSINRFFLEDAKDMYGGWHVADYCELNELVAFDDNEDVASYGFAQCLGYAYEESTYSYLGIIGIGGNYIELMSVDLTSGRMPENSSEIILPITLTYFSDNSYTTGQTITLDVGRRFIDGEPIENQFYTNIDTEYLSAFETKSYTIVGFYEKADAFYAPNPGNEALTVFDENKAEEADYLAYFELSDPDEYKSFMSENEIDDIDENVNTDLFMNLGIDNVENSYAVDYYGFVIVLVLMVVGASVILIYNTFSISVSTSDRIKEFGILSSVGSTKRQLHSMVMYEALFLYIACVPIGLALGIGAIAIVLSVLGDKFSIFAYDFNDARLQLHITPFSIIIPCIVSALTVFISAYLPAKSVTRISAMDAIKQRKQIKPVKKIKEAPPVVRKLFKLPGVIGYKYYKRNRKKYTTTILCLSASIIMYVSSATFIDDGVRSVEMELSQLSYDFEYALVNDIPNGFPDEEIQKTKSIFESIDTISNVVYVQYDSMAETTLTEDMLTDGFCLDEIYYVETENGLKFPSTIILVEDFWYEKLLSDNGLQRDEYFDTENPKAIIYNVDFFYDYDRNVYMLQEYMKEDVEEVTLDYSITGDFFNSLFSFTGLNIFDGFTVETSRTIRVGHFIEQLPFYLDLNNYGLTYIFPLSFRDSVFSNYAYFNNRSFRMNATDSQNVEQTLYEYLGDGMLPKGMILNYTASNQSTVNIVIILKVFSYSFILIISLISIANAFNTISTNFILRRREFSVLKSVGMSDYDIRKMLNFECLMYGTKALLIGVPISVIISVHIHLMTGMQDLIISGATISAILFSMLVVLSVVFAAMMYSIRKIKTHNIIDALRNENY